MTVSCQNLLLGALSSRSASTALVGELFKKIPSCFEHALCRESLQTREAICLFAVYWYLWARYWNLFFHKRWIMSRISERPLASQPLFWFTESQFVTLCVIVPLRVRVSVIYNLTCVYLTYLVFSSLRKYRIGDFHRRVDVDSILLRYGAMKIGIQ
jgi:hypothetical protein